MSSPLNLVFFGYCPITSIWIEFYRRWHSQPELAAKYRYHWWYVAAAQVPHGFFYTSGQHCILFSNDVNYPPEKRAPEYDLNDYDVGDLTKGIQGRQPRVQLPLRDHKDGEYVYIFGTPFFEFDLMLTTFSQLMASGQYASYNLLKDIWHHHYAPLFAFVHELKARDLDVILVEAQRHLPVPYNVKSHLHPIIKDEDDQLLFKKFVNKSRRILKDEIQPYGFPIVEIPEELIDEYGCLKEQFRHKPTDHRHPNHEYLNIMLDRILECVESNPFSPKPPRSEADRVAVRHSQPWRPENPILKKITPDPSKEGLLTLLKLRDDAHSRLCQKVRTLEGEHKELQAKYQTANQACEEQIKALDLAYRRERIKSEHLQMDYDRLQEEYERLELNYKQPPVQSQESAGQLNLLTEQCAELKEDCERYRRRLHRLKSSRSWKITAPLRWLGRTGKKRAAPGSSQE
jgi:hypothetical protein